MISIIQILCLGCLVVRIGSFLLKLKLIHRAFPLHTSERKKAELHTLSVALLQSLSRDASSSNTEAKHSRTFPRSDLLMQQLVVT